MVQVHGAELLHCDGQSAHRLVVLRPVVCSAGGGGGGGGVVDAPPFAAGGDGGEALVPHRVRLFGGVKTHGGPGAVSVVVGPGVAHRSHPPLSSMVIGGGVGGWVQGGGGAAGGGC